VPPREKPWVYYTVEYQAILSLREKLITVFCVHSVTDQPQTKARDGVVRQGRQH
jgi:hypothetical protein